MAEAKRAAALPIAAVLLWTLRAACFLAQTAAEPPANPEPKSGLRMQIYGFASVNTIYDINQTNPDWYDVERPSKLPSFPNEFGAER